MTGHPFPYQYLKITQAQLALMKINPFQDGAVKSVAIVLEHCTDAFKDWDLTKVKDEDACRWIGTIKRVINTTNVQDDTEEGIFYHRARVMTLEEMDDLSDALVFLLIWLDKVF